ncbi:hypothetical protein ACFFTM_19025 [Pseudoduganella plicata]|uniref:DUF4239 domain-containing protein n=1 Tax=Pseudoduganella plicata TaxID=321984 RepID=A0A4P7B8Y9_9BURK|nr:hypothetical protein [Pseudoduganella plicata]QBQ34951.1 hypothetical protein E1742_01215 [Pseudoduganella plicata]GGZ06220.1 hypothetical protein GCM10007388_44670 [Pseudoduganella plicata]
MADETTGNGAGGPDQGDRGASSGPASADRGPVTDPFSSELHKLEEFIFARELYEVFLLLDHISGRWDKGLRSNDPKCPSIVETVCKIALGSATNSDERLQRAVDTMYAKDTLNAIARPATGLSVAFTVLVIGEDDRRKPPGRMRRLCRKLFHRAAPSAPPDTQSRRSTDGMLWDKPTRVTLARYAYPGLIGVAVAFNRRMVWLVVVLVAALMLTCMLSWHVSAGNVILQHLDDVRARVVAVRKDISAAELKYAADQRLRGTDAEGRAALAPAAEAIRFCSLLDKAGKPFYRTTEEYQLCDLQAQLRDERRAAWRNLRQWLEPWKALYDKPGEIAQWFSHLMPDFLHVPSAVAPSPAETRVQTGSRGEDVRRRGSEDKARIVVLVIGTSVLPLAYGVLGAGAAVVRRLWERMRESLLSPRDSTLAWLQLALGGTIGACIALFINPSGPAPAEEHGLLGSWALSGSALSFIAGFGVEGVFRALEAFVHRVFGIHEQQPRPPGQGGTG